MTILVTGASGTVGSYVQELAPTFPEEVDLASRASLDITDRAAVMARFEHQPYTAVLHLAALTDVDRCEREPEAAESINAAGARNVALAAQAHGAEMVLVSTTMVFGGGGERGPFSERDPPRPVNAYGRTKLAAEEHVLRIVSRSYVIRTCWVMGGGSRDKKFVGKIADRLLAHAPVEAVSDLRGSPTYARDLVVAIREIMKARAYGITHVTNVGDASRYELACEMKELLGSRSVVTSVPASRFPLPAPRAEVDTSVSVVLPRIGRASLMPPWRDALARYLGRNFGLGPDQLRAKPNW